MPVDKIGNVWRVRSYVTGRLLARRYKTKAAAQAAARRSKDRSQRKRSTRSKRAVKGRMKRRGY